MLITVAIATFVTLAPATVPAHAQASVPLQVGSARAGQSYATARRHLLAAGLVPIPQTGEDRCSGRSVCKAYPEAENCLGTGTGACDFVWRDTSGRLILVSTLGDEKDIPGREVGLDLLVQGFDPAPPGMVAQQGLPDIFGEKELAARAKGSSPSAPTSGTVEPADSIAMRLWTITLNTLPDRSLFCEVAMRGRNREAGGDYAIRFRYERGTAPLLIVTYAGARIRDVPEVALTLDGRPLGSMRVKQSRMGRDEALVATIDYNWFDSWVVPAFVRPDTVGMTIMAGSRMFQAPVAGWSAVRRNLGQCLSRMAE